MGLTKINQAISALTGAGLRADRGFPGEKKPALTAPAVTVGIHRCTGESVILAATVFVAPEQGGSLCEDTAQQVVGVLEGLGALCTQEACQYDRTWGLLSVKVLAAWEQASGNSGGGSSGSGTAALGCTVTADGQTLSYVTGVKAEHKADLHPIGAVGVGTVVTRWEVTYWDITVEELLPLSQRPEEIGIQDFDLYIRRAGGTEKYTTCSWISVRREDTPQGVKQVRVARTWEEREITNG